MYHKKAHIHFVGIGGIGMSGIATILKYQGYTISGCDNDLQQQSIIDLQKIGCLIFEGNNTVHCQNAPSDILVYSSAIKVNNPEIINAQQRGIPTISRALMLAELMRTKYSIAISGSHGKTTTTSLISHILIEAERDPTVIIGGHLKNISTNARFGNGDFLVAEADESDRSLLSLQATLAVVTNIDLEHLETYTDIDDIKNTFKQFLNNLPFYGKAFLCIDDPHIRSLLPLAHLKTIKYGLNPLADFKAENIQLEADHSLFELYIKKEKHGIIRINMLANIMF
ncbi:MAG: Mur ligase family protein [Candidatus Babeliales bacterium]